MAVDRKLGVRMSRPMRKSVRSFGKRFGDLVALCATWPCAWTCWLERALCPQAEGVFLFWAHWFAMAPGVPGVYLRRGFYRQTLDRCDAEFHIGFGAYFTHREVRVEQGVYIGAYALIGSAILRRGCLIGSRASLLSGGQLHQMDEHGNWTSTDRSRLQQIEIGENAWIGEGAISMADVGARAMIAAGAVVSTAVPDRVMVAGNPARFVRNLATQSPAAGEPERGTNSPESLSFSSREARP